MYDLAVVKTYKKSKFFLTVYVNYMFLLLNLSILLKIYKSAETMEPFLIRNQNFKFF